MKNKTRRDFLKKMISAIVAAPALSSVVGSIPVSRDGSSSLPMWRDLGGDHWTSIQPIEGSWEGIFGSVVEEAVNRMIASACIPAHLLSGGPDGPGDLSGPGSILGQ